MKRAWAAFLLICLWVTIPVAALPFRICLLEQRVLVPSISAAWQGGDEAGDCCEECDRGNSTAPPCCVDLEKLPDSPLPQVPVEIPPVLISWLPDHHLVPCTAWEKFSDDAIAIPLWQGRASPAAFRAVLEVWSL
ncbi:MAG: hypothetical protein MUF13_02445 [Akkermansiaceae bacterium]|jgi:hypothetical protein|nr:hypothetical protein [Akkermansiaceae bacterium]